MKIAYLSQNPQSGVINYEVDDNSLSIILEFKHGKFRYLYDGAAPGSRHVTAMIELAKTGKGLSTYVSKHVQRHYAAKLPL